MKHYNKDIINTLITITIIQVILSGIGIFFNLVFKVFRTNLISSIPDDEIMINISLYFIGIALTISITAFFTKLGSKI